MFDPTSWNAPFAVVVVALFAIVMARANATYWLGRGLAAGAARTRWQRLLTSPHYASGARWLNRWGAPAVSLSFLTVGIQTMVNLAAGVTRMPLRRYLPAVTVGCIIWAFMYGTVGFIGWYAVVRLWERSPALTVAVLAAGAAVVVWVVTRRDRAEAVPAAE
ncbi:DedA family protein [Tessaracoccus lapidicaptus]|uniref:DedA family protein n=1 Tax=Tessaracoccus lapidicaptus TaxID=1427523 RepID=UPI00333E883A